MLYTYSRTPGQRAQGVSSLLQCSHSEEAASAIGSPMLHV